MSNDYFNNDTAVARHTRGRADDINSRFDAVAAGFELLPGVDQLARGRVTFATDTGSAGAMVVALPNTLTAYQDGTQIAVKVNATNTGAATINVDGLGPRAVRSILGTDLVAGDLTAGDYVLLICDETNTKWILIGFQRSLLTRAETAATGAAASETAAAASETSAQTASLLAITAQGAAESSETAAASSATAAATSATNAANSASSAATSATNAATSETSASQSATAAAASQTAAASSASAASLSQAGAVIQRDEAQTFATQASTSATAAAASETNAGTSETNAAASATAAAASAASTLSSLQTLDTDGLNETLGITALGAFIYDTSLDSDGGAWRNKCGWTSWEREDRPTGTYLGVAANETAARAVSGADTGSYYYNSTSNTFRELDAGSGDTEVFRGSDQQFPAVALITWEAGRVIIWNALTGAMFWVVQQGGAFLGFAPNTSISMRNGVLLRGSLFSSTQGEVYVFDFPADDMYYFDANGLVRRTGVDGTLANKAVAGTSSVIDSSQPLVSSAVLSLAQTVLPNAPINSETGLPYVTTVVGTEGGLTILDGPAGVGTAVDITYTGTANTFTNLVFRSDGALVYSVGNTVVDERFLKVEHTLPSEDVPRGDWWLLGDGSESYSSHPNLGFTGVSLILGADGTQNNSHVSAGENFVAREDQVNFLYPNPSSPSDGGQVIMQDDNISPVMHGGTLFAGLASTDDTDLVGGTDPDRSPQANDLTVTGTITRTKVATGADLVGYGPMSASNYLTLDRSDFAFGTGDFSFFCHLNGTGIGDYILDARPAAGGIGFGGHLDGTGALIGFTSIGGGTSTLASNTSVNDGEWHMVGLVVSDSGTQFDIFIDGRLDNSSTVTARDISALSEDIRVGIQSDLTDGFSGDLALLSIIPKALTAEQIKLKYDIERWWFQEDAVVTLDSGTVRYVAFDEALNRYHVLTDTGHSVFDARTLTRLSYEAGDWDWITADNGMVAKG